MSYLESILQARGTNRTQGLGVYTIQYLEPYLKKWEYYQLIDEIFLSGSSAKNTAIKGKSDVDVFISLKPDTAITIKDIYHSLSAYLANRFNNVRKQNTSFGLQLLDPQRTSFDVDIVPAKQYRDPYREFHQIYQSDTGNIVQTNPKKHKDYVIASRKEAEIKLMKIFRECHKINCPALDEWKSIYIEHSVIQYLCPNMKWSSPNLETRKLVADALLSQKTQPSLGDSFLNLLTLLADNFSSQQVIDVANPNNILSAELSSSQKIGIQSAIKKTVENAQKSRSWESVVW